MRTAKRSIRQSISLSRQTARRVKSLARSKRTSTSRVLAELVEEGLDARAAEREHFFAVGERLLASTDNREKRRLRDELTKLTFGE